MPTVKDKTTGKVISQQPYNNKGIENAAIIADSKPEGEVVNAPERVEKYQLGGSVDPMNPKQAPRMNYGEQPAASPTQGHSVMTDDRQWWGGTKPPNEPRQELVMKKGGKVKKYGKK